ncbi:MAG: long-chain fatty acid--CoA ligase [Rhodothermus sp.]|nr:long-chain fatty acid--CoA ligase [Rhodothermus sp.]
MPALVAFETIPQLFYRLWDHFRGQQRPVLRYKDKRTKTWVDITWEELEQHVHALAGYLYKQGVRPGDRVAILSENRPEWVITDLATQILGGVNVALYTSLPASQVGYIVKDAGARVLVVSSAVQLRKAEAIFDDCPELQEIITLSTMRKDHPSYVRAWDDVLAEGAAYWTEHAAELSKLAKQVQPDDLSALIYTSGTTGLPKGVMLTHRNFCANVLASLHRVDFGPQDHHISFLPLCHSFERTAGYTAVLACGARISYAESIEALSQNLLEVRPTVMISVPRLFERVYNAIHKSVEKSSPLRRKIFHWAVSVGRQMAACRQAGHKPSPLLQMQHRIAHRLVFQKLHDRLGGRVRFAVSGGAALPKHIGEFFQAIGLTIIEGYGLTETAPVLAVNPMDRPRFGTVGWVIPGVTIAIQRLTDGKIIGQLSGDDYPSDLTTEEGEILVKGPNVMKGYWNNEEATREVFDAEGWFHTGDVGRFDQGYLVITDRIKHMIVSRGGKNIYPGPIEEQLSREPWIDQIVVIGEGREFLTALIVPDFEVLRQYAQAHDLQVETDEALLNHPDIQALFEQSLRRYNRHAPAHERIRAFRLLHEPFTIENGLLTPTLKPRRRQIETHYADLIAAMYSEFGSDSN